ncbi:biopolymer transporter ExbB [Blastomonas marina]|uniref:Biopolymer transport protein ExbB n=1 Tax=Blastomonas marina TaxID=1867408 RepID=A0ABQ1FGD0_9SPHN|nr:MotA/TolQ/ExbB proton channel family protein [Blastomonas marina]GGA11388.1 biopolymer transporter ExbB [Blastomonas marina]
MLLEILATAAAEGEEIKNAFGFWEALEQGGAVAYATVIILAIMSFGSFFILFTKFFEQAKIMRQYKKLRGSFWRASSLKEGATKLEKDSAWRQIVDDGIVAEEQHQRMTDSLEAHDWLHGSLSRSEDTINAKLASGLPFLATVGATSPFIGLFGTVVGIYRALINIGIAGSASIDKVAGPVGEALIMTALGLLVAVPAVLAYNYLQARNKRIAEMLHGFSTDVLAYISSDGKVKPVVATAAPAKATSAAKPVPAKAGAPGTSTTTPPTKR